jgi:hypothetical protein
MFITIPVLLQTDPCFWLHYFMSHIVRQCFVLRTLCLHPGGEQGTATVSVRPTTNYRLVRPRGLLTIEQRKR